MSEHLLIAGLVLLLIVAAAQHYIGRQQQALLHEMDDWTMTARLAIADARQAIGDALYMVTGECSTVPCEQPATHGDKCARHAPTSTGVDNE